MFPHSVVVHSLIPNPNNINFPRFETGTKTFTLIDDADNNQDKCNTLTDETYTAAGTLETVQENILSIRNARIEQRHEFQEQIVHSDLGTEVVGSQVVGQESNRANTGWYDPLAQSFLVEDPGGSFCN